MQSNWHSNSSIKMVILNSLQNNPKSSKSRTIVVKVQYITKVQYPMIPSKTHQI